MSEFFCNKVKTATSWALVPAHQADEDLMKKLPLNTPLKTKVTQIRNVGHHRKYFALINYAFDVWEPTLKHSDMERACQLNIMPGDIQKNRDRFRADITILAGFYETTFRLNGEFRIEPKSIKFTSMAQDEFEILYDKTIDVLLNYVQQLDGFTADQLRETIEQILEFDS